MASMFEEVLFRLDQGMDKYNPPISSSNLKLSELRNVEPKNMRLKSSLKQQLYETIAGANNVINIFQYISPNSVASNVYAATTDSMFYFSENESFDVDLGNAAIVKADNVPYSVVPWGDALYLTRPGQPILKLELRTLSTVDSTFDDVNSYQISARYMIESNNHLFTANIQQGPTKFFSRTRWSDLYRPEVFNDNEADSFDIDSSAGAITGLSNQRGYTVIYAVNAIWRANYVGGTGVYEFEPIFTGIGNQYHYAQAQVKEVDFFIGQDNFYMLDGVQPPRQVGDAIWDFFRETQDSIGYTSAVRSYVDELRQEIHWIYKSVEGYRNSLNQWSVVYNYKEDKWSNRDPQDQISALFFKQKARVLIPINNWTLATYGTVNAFDEGGTVATTLIDGDWQYKTLNYTNFTGGQDGKIYNQISAFAKYNNASFPVKMETYEFDFESYFGKKELNAFKILYKRTGVPNIKLTVLTRDSQSEDFVTSPVFESSVMTGNDKDDSQSIFYIRRSANGATFGNSIGKFIKFIIEVDNTDENYVEEFYGIAFKIKLPLERDDVQK